MSHWKVYQKCLFWKLASINYWVSNYYIKQLRIKADKTFTDTLIDYFKYDVTNLLRKLKLRFHYLFQKSRTIWRLNLQTSGSAFQPVFLCKLIIRSYFLNSSRGPQSRDTRSRDWSSCQQAAPSTVTWPLRVPLN